MLQFMLYVTSSQTQLNKDEEQQSQSMPEPELGENDAVEHQTGPWRT